MRGRRRPWGRDHNGGNIGVRVWIYRGGVEVPHSPDDPPPAKPPTMPGVHPVAASPPVNVHLLEAPNIAMSPPMAITVAMVFVRTRPKRRAEYRHHGGDDGHSKNPFSLYFSHCHSSAPVTEASPFPQPPSRDAVPGPPLCGQCLFPARFVPSQRQIANNRQNQAPSQGNRKKLLHRSTPLLEHFQVATLPHSTEVASSAFHWVSR